MQTFQRNLPTLPRKSSTLPDPVPNSPILVFNSLHLVANSPPFISTLQNSFLTLRTLFLTLRLECQFSTFRFQHCHNCHHTSAMPPHRWLRERGFTWANWSIHVLKVRRG